MFNYTYEAILLSILALHAFTLYKIYCIQNIREDLEQLKTTQSEQLKH